ncbi:transporter substrate-binding domain-containing protein [Burkholderia sp. Ac-20379]|nr:transporter substrate-binding domain-containing protein [Burkholderia sp. Ac-20379]
MKKIKRHWLIAGALAAVLVSNVRADPLLDAVKRSGTLRVAVEGTYPPFSFRAPNGEMDGFDVDVARQLAKRLGVKAQFLGNEFSGMFAGIASGRFDIVADEVAITPERQAAVDFSTPYVQSAPQLLQRANDPRSFGSLAELKGLKIGTVLGGLFQKIAESEPGVSVVTYSDQTQEMSDLASRRIDAALNDQLMIAYLIERSHLPIKASATLPKYGYVMAFPFKKGNPDFKAAVDKALDDMRRDGTLKAISTKWFNRDATQVSGG